MPLLRKGANEFEVSEAESKANTKLSPGEVTFGPIRSKLSAVLAMSATTKLHVLAQDGDHKLLAQALKTSDNPNIIDQDGMTALHYAAWYGHPNCCQALLSASASIDAFDHDGASALHAAAYNGQLGCVILLVENGASAFSADNENHTPKDSAIAEKHRDVVAYLRAVEEDQRREAEVERYSKLLAEAQAHAKAFKPELAQAVKDARKKQNAIEKEAKKTRKETLKLKRLRTKKMNAGGANLKPETEERKPSPLTTMKREKSKSRNNSSSSVPSGRTTPADEPAAIPESRPLPEVPAVSPEVAAEMVLAEFEADSEGGGGLIAFLESLDLKEFARLVTKEVSTLEDLQKLSAADLQRMGLPTGARKKIMATLHPK